MEYKKPILKEPGIDYRATLLQLTEVGDAVFIPFRSDVKPATLRMAVSRANLAGEPKYSSHETLNGHVIIRKA